MKIQDAKKTTLIILVVASSFAFGACGMRNQTKAQRIGGAVTQAVDDNQKAESLIEWQASPNNPEKLFSEWNLEYIGDPAGSTELTQSICTSLLKLNEQDLSLFENALNEKENEALVSACKTQLLKKIDNYYIEQRQDIGAMDKATFNFPDNIQKRDMANGYYAVSGDVATKEVVLTFDDGPSGAYTQTILKALRDVNAKAVFFHLGKSVRANPEIVKMVAADGHTVGSHSTTHACLGTRTNCYRSNGRYLSFNEAVNEIKGGHQAIYDVLGWVDPFFRFPYGETSPELKKYLANNSIGEFYWAVDSEDWKSQSNQSLIDGVFRQLESRKRGVILFHDIQRKTAESLPTILKELYNRGYSPVLLQASDPDARFNSKIVKRKLP
jgi:Predicted xylanase/chitin deacetylase